MKKMEGIQTHTDDIQIDLFAAGMCVSANDGTGNGIFLYTRGHDPDGKYTEANITLTTEQAEALAMYIIRIARRKKVAGDAFGWTDEKIKNQKPAKGGWTIDPASPSAQQMKQSVAKRMNEDTAEGA